MRSTAPAFSPWMSISMRMVVLSLMVASSPWISTSAILKESQLPEKCVSSLPSEPTSTTPYSSSRSTRS